MQRLTCLDGLRGGLALYVMVGHTLPFASVPGWLGGLFSHGGAAVDAFFILSGLVIVQSLASYDYRPRPFLIARVARIYPVFLAAFALAVAVQPFPPGLSHMPWIGHDSQARFIWSGSWPSDWAIGIAAHVTMSHGLFPDGVLPDVWVGWLGAAWSLSTEWQFYLLVVLIGDRLGRDELALGRLAGLFLIVSAFAIAWHWTAPETWRFSRAFLPNKAQYFALGIASAMLVRQRAAALRCYLIVLFATLVLCAAQGGAEKLVAPLGWTCCLAAQLRPDQRLLRPLTVALRSLPAVWLGAVSYSVYLVHEPVQKLLGLLLALTVQGNATLFSLLWLPGALLLPLLAAWWLHERIEAPALRWGKAFAHQDVAFVAGASSR